MSNWSSKDKVVLYDPVTLKFWACRNWQFRKMKKKKKEAMNRKWAKFTYYTVLIIPRLHYHGLSLERESNKRIRNEASTMSRLSNGVWTKQQTDCTHQGHGLQSLSAVLPIVWKQVLEASCPPGTLGALSICQNWTAKEFIFLSPEMTILVTLLSQNRQFSLLLCRFLGTFVCVNVRPFLPMQSVSKWNGLFPKGFAEKPSPSCTLFRIWLIWLDRFD